MYGSVHVHLSIWVFVHELVCVTDNSTSGMHYMTEWELATVPIPLRIQ